MILSEPALKVCRWVVEYSHKQGLMGRVAFTAFEWVIKSHDSLFAANAKLSFENMNLKAENERLRNELKGANDIELTRTHPTTA